MAERWLLLAALLHVLLAAALLGALRMDGLTPIGGVHPALKPLKFAVSIAIFLGTMALFVEEAGWSRSASRLLAALLVGTMLVEMACILVQAARGTTSHFNTHTPFHGGVWSTMMLAIVVATFAMLAAALVATFSPLDGASALRTWAWRLGLWFFLLVALSGFGMGGRGQHSVGGTDGGVGLAFTNWSTTHGDLRVPHFFALHVLQVLPASAWLLDRLPAPEMVRRGAFAGVVLLASGMCLFTLRQALAGLPALPPSLERSQQI
ncbi:MAG: hypothetical protein AAFU79_08530 [Myxococcota bacterium]